jgi:hypothetical protein
MIVAWALVNYWQRGRGRGAMANIISHGARVDPRNQISDLRTELNGVSRITNSIPAGAGNALQTVRHAGANSNYI